MSFNIPKDDGKYRWTQHVVRKMMYYGLSADRVKRVIRNPVRMEEGIAPGTLAAMQKAGTPKKPTEIWVMYATKVKNEKSKIKNKLLTLNSKLSTDNFLPQQKIVITAWRYPGVSPVRAKIPIPSDILQELRDMQY